jgi:glycosyl transferase family 2
VAGEAELTDTGPRLSVVIASQAAPPQVEECLTALSTQAGESVAIVLVNNGTDDTAAFVRQKFPQVRVLSVGARALVPELWEAGIRATNAEIVALGTVNCVPADGWVAGILNAHRRPVAGVGGTIACDPGAGVLDRAVYLCRYSAYMPPAHEGLVSDIAGDNASYKRVAIEECRDAWRRGFWEADVHVALERAGQKLWLDPSITVVFRNGFGFWEFVRQRFQHGMRFGRDRSARLPWWERGLRVLLWPAVPLVMLLRVGQRTLARPSLRGGFATAIPILTVFLIAWALGEAVGYLRGR